MGTGDENRWWSDPDERVRVFDVDPETGHYRRFFDIDDLAGVRVEDPEVFSLTHDKVLSLVADGVVDGLRIDHPDGLADPAGYLERVARRRRRARVDREDPASRRGAARLARRGDRRLRVPQRRPGRVHRPGGRGAADGAVRVARRRRALVRRDRAGGAARAGARDVRARGRAAAADPRSRAGWRRRWRGCRSTARTCATACFTPDDRAALEAAGRPDLFDGAPEEFVSRFQQTSPPVTAKGIEDTGFYRYLRLLALNDVGSDPGRWGVSVDEFHAANVERARALPARAAHHADARHEALRRRARAARRAERDGVGVGVARALRWYALTEELVAEGAPDMHERYLVFQTLVAVWPISARAAGGLHREGAARGEAQHELGRPEPRLGVAREGVRRERCSTFEPFLDDFLPFVERRSRPPASARRSASSC